MSKLVASTSQTSRLIRSTASSNVSSSPSSFLLRRRNGVDGSWRAPNGNITCTCRRRFTSSSGDVSLEVSAAEKALAARDLSRYPPSMIRNFAVIAHIDAGKSTLSDRLMETAGNKAVAQAQLLDTLKVERERGITVRSQSVSMFYTHSDGKEYLLNLLDTPGHVDFSSELLRALLPSQGAVLLADGAQGIQAQTLSVLEEARKRDLEVVGVVNKWDVVSGDDRGPAVVSELATLLSCKEENILRVSAKTGDGITSVFESIIDRIPPPKEVVEGEKLRALVFDSWHNSFKGVISLVAIVEGELRQGDSITSTTTKKSYPILDLGILSPQEVSIAEHPNPQARVLRKGMVGWLVCGMKDVNDAYLGDTFHHSHSTMPALESFNPLKPMVFAGIYPLESGRFLKLEEAVKKLTLTDRSVTSLRESSSFLGQGFRLGFSGALHLDVFRQRLEDEAGEEVITTRPFIPIQLVFRNGITKIIENPADFPDPGGMLKIEQVLEPIVHATIVAPEQYAGSIINLCTAHRGVPLSHTYLSQARVTLLYALPLSEIITTFHSDLKSLSSGFASFDYTEAGYEVSDLVRMNILVNSQKVDALSSVVHRSAMEKEGREWARRLKEVVPKQQYEVIIQAAVGTHIISRERVAPMSKNVLAGLYGGDVTRKMKMQHKQKVGKARLKERSIGNVVIPTSAFFTVLGGQTGKRKNPK